jgi:dipeptidyl aminopeptidase/acylaminoacyl peptidase
MQAAPYGSWRSPITAETIVSDSIGLSSIVVDGTDIYWLESRPQETGRSAIVRQRSDGKIEEITPAGYSVRSRVHEYGGAAYTVYNGHVYFSNASDGSIYTQDLNSDRPQHVQNITETTKTRYADLIFAPRDQRIICVREEHDEAALEPLNTIVGISITNSLDVQVLAGGNDFYASPALSPDGHKLAWLSWNHPNLPWDGTNLQIADITVDGALAGTRLIAGGPKESIFQPQWSPDGVLYFISDRSDWGNIYRWNGKDCEPIAPMMAEFGMPQWVFGMSTYAFADKHRIVCTYSQDGTWRMALINLLSQRITPLNTRYTDISGVRTQGKSIVCLAASPTQATAVVKIDLISEAKQVIKKSTALELDLNYLSQPQAIEFPTTNHAVAYGFYYPPTNPDYRGEPGELPPLLVKIHGGPTAATSNQLNLRTQYWTSRGFGVMDVNYGGSTGYGREYRQRLEAQWGVVDVDDCCNAAKYLAAAGMVDGNRMAISGSSAGGYTALCALTFRDVFKAGASYYGISDLIALTKETHKFESRYNDRLISPYPAGAAIYQARSPIHFTHQISCPIIFFQGMEDKVVPPNQAEMIVNALNFKGLPIAYVTFPTEGHGFRQAETIKRALTGEFYFYSRIFGFQSADAIDPVEIHNL